MNGQSVNGWLSGMDVEAEHQKTADGEFGHLNWRHFLQERNSLVVEFIEVDFFLSRI